MRSFERHGLTDETAHRDTEIMYLTQLQGPADIDDIVRHQLNRVRRPRAWFRGTPETTQIDRNDVIVRREHADLIDPQMTAGAQPMHEENRFAVSPLAYIELEFADSHQGHDACSQGEYRRLAY